MFRSKVAPESKIARSNDQYSLDHSGLEAFKADVQLMVDNCITFNDAPDPGIAAYRSDARKLETAAADVFRKCSAQVSSAAKSRDKLLSS